MNLLFVQGGELVKKDDLGNYYTSGSFHDIVWDRYKAVADSLTVILKCDSHVYNHEELETKFNRIDLSKVNLIAVEDLYIPKYKLFNIHKRKQISEKIDAAVRKSDKVILRPVSNFYTATAWKACKKHGKTYLLEVTGHVWGARWYSGWKGKLLAYPDSIRMKKAARQAPYALYVTQSGLQNSYPCDGVTIGCSDVVLPHTDREILNHRIEHISTVHGKYRIGTIGGYSKLKGQKLVLKALGLLKREGIDNIEYQLVGGGDLDEIKADAEKYGVSNQVVALGSMSHDQVFAWIDELDVYIQPSYQEGLCRSVVEAISRACPVICSDACGNSELANHKYIFHRGGVATLAGMIKELLFSDENMRHECIRSYEKSLEYAADVLNVRRNNFLKAFTDS